MTGFSPLLTWAWTSFDNAKAGWSSANAGVWAMARKIGQRSPRLILVVVVTFMILGVKSSDLLGERELGIAALLGPFIESDRKEDDQPDDRCLPERGDPKQDQSVSQDADDQDSENRTEDGALTARKRSPADDRCGNDVELQPHAGSTGLAAR